MLDSSHTIPSLPSLHCMGFLMGGGQEPGFVGLFLSADPAWAQSLVFANGRERAEVGGRGEW